MYTLCIYRHQQQRKVATVADSLFAEKLLYQKKEYQRHLRTLQKALRHQHVTLDHERREIIASSGVDNLIVMRRRKSLGVGEPDVNPFQRQQEHSYIQPANFSQSKTAEFEFNPFLVREALLNRSQVCQSFLNAMNLFNSSSQQIGATQESNQLPEDEQPKKRSFSIESLLMT